ncbi:MAG: UDP-N-acetylmuramoyl-L-alanyl-D-glutamate--2,6-diaminopimelate ligase [Clostridia bacterium]|nr:UDP-N-acetylmuramoyl-L-alanyl-D-glutamate--2,6-diaminopimelate ligase [Clostridia bacterium]
MLLSEIVAHLGSGIVGTHRLFEGEVTGVSEHSKDVRRGFIFCALRGKKENGESYIKEALALGAVCVLVGEDAVLDASQSAIISKNPRKTMAEISKMLYGDCLCEMKIIGITGTKGKSTVCEYLREALLSVGEKCVSIGTLGIRGLKRPETKINNTTPPSTVIYRTLRDAYEEGIRTAIIEVSSAALTDYRVYGIRFDTVIYTGFSYDHIGKGEHSNMREYFSSKRRLFTDYGASVAIVYDDGEPSRKISYGIDEIIRVGENKYDEAYISDITSLPTGSSYRFSGRVVRISLGGRFNAINSSLALCAAMRLTGLAVDSFLPSLLRTRVSGRCEHYTLRGVNLLIDYAHNGESLREILTYVRRTCFGRIIAVFGSVGERSQSRRRELAIVAEELCDLSVITSDNPGEEDAYAICRQIADCFTDMRLAKIITDREEAIRYALSVAREGDYVLLLGKGHEAYQLVGREKIPFSEREIILSLGAVPNG